MKKVKLLQAMFLDGVAYAVGDVAVVDESIAIRLTKGGKAQEVTIKGAKAPEGVATAVPGGKRPSRKRPN
jgi:hypothetical protein